MADAAVRREYGPDDTERLLPETHSSRRSDFARDRARLLHSSGLRRLAAKTQVLSPTAGLDFARTRLTHSLEVAQVGRELATRLGLDPDLVDTACLAHDIGHPPFGHNGERALDAWAAGIGGFEGNAQTFRLLTRLEPKVFDAHGNAYGLNLTRASLDASCKYPWRAAPGEDADRPRGKFGYYADDADVFAWVRRSAPAGALCIEAQVMDLADDIAYSVHDFEDAVVGGYLEVAGLPARFGDAAYVAGIVDWAQDEFGREDVAAAFERLETLDLWLAAWSGSRPDQARLKNLTSQLIGRFAGAAIEATRAAFTARDVGRHGADIVVPREIAAEIAVLKGIVAADVMTEDTRQSSYARQRELLTDLADALLAHGPDVLEQGFAADWRRAPDEEARRRVVVDQVASLTDQSAIAWYEDRSRR